MSWRPLFLLLATLYSLPLWSGIYDPRLKWKTVKTDHFAIHYYEGEEEVVERLVGFADEVYQTITKKFEAYPVGRTELVVTDQEDQSNAFALLIPYNMITLRVVAPSPDNILADYDEWLRELLTHEFTHIVHISDTQYPAKALKLIVGKLMAPNGLSPGWVTEGIATYFETVETTRGRGRSSFTDMLLRTDILNDGFLKLDQMAGAHYSWPSWMAQYLYGVSFWQYLTETYGEQKVAEFSRRYGRSLWFFSLNNKAKKTFGKSFYQLWRDWKGALQVRYSGVKRGIETDGVAEGNDFLKPKKGESLVQPRLSGSGRSLVYIANSIHHPAELRWRNLESGKEKVLLKRKEITGLTISPDEKRIIYATIGKHKRFYNASDLHEIEIETGKKKQLTKGKRARDPDFSPDGKEVVLVLQETGRSHLAFYNLEKKEFLKGWWDEKVPLGTEYNQPSWSPDGRWIAVSVHEGRQRDLWLIEKETGRRKRVTNDVAVEAHPEWGGGDLFFSSDRTGIPNLYRYDPHSGKTTQVTNVITGAFHPAVATQGEVFFQYYFGRGFEIRRLQASNGAIVSGFLRNSSLSSSRRPLLAGTPPASEELAGQPLLASALSESSRLRQTGPRDPPTTAPLLAEKYQPYRKLFLPRYLLPNAALIDNAFFFSVTLSNNDPLLRHLWFGDVTFRSDNQFVGYDFGYAYQRWVPTLSVGSSLYSVNFGDLFRLGQNFYERRMRGSGGFSFPKDRHNISLAYFFEDRSEESGLPAGTTLSTLGHYSGLFLQYRYSNLKKSVAAISTEEGYRFTLNGELTDEILGAGGNLEQEVVWGDARQFVPLGRHHVLAFRAAGGAAFGDQLIQGNFGLGGSLGEGPFTGSSSRLFTLRGLPFFAFAADRAWVGSFEYRLPLFYLERGLGTLPGHANAAHFALFADVGDVMARANPRLRPLVGVGAELRGEFVIGYYLPVTGRLGYGLILTNRQRIAGFADSLMGTDARNGVLILELGTSF